MDQVRSISFILLYLLGFQMLVLGSTPSNALQLTLGIGLGEMRKVIMPEFGCFFVPAKSYVASVAVDRHVARIVRYHDVMIG